MSDIDPVIVHDIARGIELVRGPQDGSRVSLGNGRLPQVLFVGRHYMGDGRSAWGRVRSERFPCRYEFDGTVFRYTP